MVAVIPAVILGAVQKVAANAIEKRLKNRDDNRNLTVSEVKEAVVEEFKEEVEKNPELQNELNLEPLSQSRVVRGNVAAAVATLITSAIIILRALGVDIPFGETEVAAIVAAVGALGGIGYSIYGRVASGLKPAGVK